MSVCPPHWQNQWDEKTVQRNWEGLWSGLSSRVQLKKCEALCSSTNITPYKNVLALHLLCLDWLIQVVITEAKSWVFGKMWEHVRICRRWMDHTILIGRMFALVYLLLFLWDKMVHPWTLIVEFPLKTSGPICKWKKQFPPWKSRWKFCFCTMNPRLGCVGTRKVS
jgi:hypothetical protein